MLVIVVYLLHYIRSNISIQLTGKLPEKDLDFTPSSEWFESAGISSREDIIKLNVGREPRFYAWMALTVVTTELNLRPVLL